MRKITKMAVTLAAMTAMTVAAASMTFAAEDGWSGDNRDGWTYTKDGKKVTGWNQIDGVWYYFEKNGDMAQEELVYIQGETYYFNADGSMMANGWVGFDNDSDVLYDYGLDIDDNIEDIRNPVFKDASDAYETVWLYFNTDGSAKDDEWYQADSGLWFHFDDIIMVAGDFDHEIGNARYGFDENGYMLVGWAQNYVDGSITAPNKDDKTWYYYEPVGGKKFATSRNTNDKSKGEYGWKKIDGSWYCFKEEDASVGTLIVNTFFDNNVTAGGGGEFYYVDKKGVMASGVSTVDKGAKIVDAKYYWKEEDGPTGKVDKYVDANWEVYFNNDGKAQKNKWSGDRYYADVNSSKVVYLNSDKDFELTAYADHSVANAVTGSAYTKKDDKTASDIRGALVKNSFITETNDTFYVDKYGDKVTSSAIQVGYVTATRDAKDKDKYTSDTTFKLFSTEDAAEAALGGSSTDLICKAYVVLNAKGIAYDDVNAGRTASAGSKKYVSTGDAVEDENGLTLSNADLFYYYNKN